MENTLELRRVTKRYDKFVAVDDLSLTIEKGSVFGLLGPNGAGKTSTIRMMMGITMPDSGEVIVFGEPYKRAHLDRIGYLPEERGLYKKMKLVEQLAFLAELKGVPTGEATRRARQWCERLELSAWTEKKVEELSKGMQQKVQFIAAILHDPEFLILDEPFSGLDYQTKLLVSEDIYKIIRNEKKTTIMVTHDIAEAISFCDRIIILTERPARIKKIHEIKLSLNEEKTPLKARKSPDFKDYFDLLWRELNE
jgi:ABC-2 type transport system ATP-binding protein